MFSYLVTAFSSQLLGPVLMGFGADASWDDSAKALCHISLIASGLWSNFLF